MTSFLDQPELRYVGVAVFMLGIAFSIIKWVGRTLREQLGSGVRKTDDVSAITHVDTVPPALVKEAIERGLITPAQLAGMATMERQFVFASIKDRLTSTPEAGTASTGASRAAAPATPRAAGPPGSVGGAGPLGAARPSGARSAALPAAMTAPRAWGRMSGAAFGLASMPMNDRLRVHCPTCGELLALPAFAPFVAHCAHCGTRTAVREDEPGHYLLNVSPPKTE
jgi:hypothetical protein